MRILMLGNSFTFYNDMPNILAKLTDAEVVQHTRGGARLAEHLNPETTLGALTSKALENEKWDYVVLQEQSNAPITTPNGFFRSVEQLCEKIKSIDAVPILYCTWAYQKDGTSLEKFGMDYEEMYQKLNNAYYQAAKQNNALIADVGKAFYENSLTKSLYHNDSKHPSLLGSQLAAETIAAVINSHKSK